MTSTLDLYETAQYPYIRMSATAKCRHAIGHMMIGTEQRQRGFNDLSMRMGTALEPMVVQWLADQGVLCYFTGEDQLEVALQDPYRLGHLDGVIGLDGEPSYWVRHNFPPRALEILTAGIPMMLEVKTMNEDAFDQFLKGGLAAGVFLKDYIDQATSYLASLRDSANDELWPDHPDRQNPDRIVLGSTSYKALLRSRGWSRPSSALVVVFNPATKRFAFEIIEFDQEAFDRRTAELAVVPDYLRAGELPPPDYDGQAAQCYFCYYAYVCPAVQAIAASRALDDIPIVLEENIKEMDELAAQYAGLTAEIKSMESRKAEIRRELESRAGAARVTTPGYMVTFSSVKGRRGMDQAQIKADYKEMGKEIPYKVGTPFTRLLVTPLFGPSAGPDSGSQE